MKKANEMSASFRLREGDLEFEFQNHLQVWRVDSSPHYRKYLTAWKAVDFVITHPEARRSWWVEIKDYSAHPRRKRIDLIDELVEKVAGTAIAHVATRFCGSKQEDVDHANFALASTDLHFILQLEQPKHPSKLFPELISHQDLKEGLKARLGFIARTVVITSVISPSKKVPWTRVARTSPK